MLRQERCHGNIIPFGRNAREIEGLSRLGMRFYARFMPEVELGAWLEREGESSTMKNYIEHEIKVKFLDEYYAKNRGGLVYREYCNKKDIDV